jgi:hypothetical protein
MIIAVSAVTLALAAPALAQSTSSQPNNSASPAKEADKMKSGDTAGSAPNSSNPGANPGADGNKTQDSRTTKNKDR